MGSDPSEVQETPSLSSVKVHLGICKQFLRLVQKISYILPKIEAVRPGASQGMQALVQLQKANDKAKELIQNCDSSKLYLAVIGNEIVKRFENTRTLLVQSLSKLQNMVPVVLVSQISEILSDLLAAVFYMEPNEALAGKALKALLERDSSLVNSEIELLQIATSALHISSQKDILIERRSIKKLLGKTKDGNSKKKITLTYFFHVLKKYNEQIVQAQARDPLTEDGQIYLPGGLNSDTVIPNTTDLDAHQTSVPYRSSPPEEFICFLCSNLMHDPVIISSGQTFDRSCIQKLFDEGCDTCPKTNTKLTSLLAIPNTSMKGLIFKWSMEYGVNISEPSSSIPENGCLETSYNSICSAASSMNDVNLRMNMSSISLRSLDSSYSSISSHNRSGDSFSYVREVSTVDSYDFQFYRSIDDIQRRFLSNVSGFPWESQCCAVQDVNNFMIYNNPSCSFVSTENFLDPLVQFLHDALDKRDEEALKVGNQLLLTFLKASRTEISQLTDALYNVLASILATQPMTETLSVIDVLSSRANAIPHLESSGILTSITTLLDSHSRDFQETAIKILHDLSMNLDASSCKLASDWIPKLVPFLEDGKVARTIIGIFENLSKFEETRVALAETNGCIASIIKLLEAEISSDAQEHAVGILLFLCAQRSCYCKLVSDEGGVIALFHLSVNGTLKGRSSASELLRLLRDIDEEVGNEQQEYPVLDQDVYEHPSENENSENKPPKSSRFSGWKAKMFSKKK